MRTYTVFNQRLAGYLMLNGFVLEGIAPSKKNPSKRVFFFRNSNELQDAINKFLEK